MSLQLAVHGSVSLHYTTRKPSTVSQSRLCESGRALKTVTKGNIFSHISHFPTEQIARALAPRVDPIDICLAIDVPFYRPRGETESKLYDPLCRFLEDCISICMKALNDSSQSNSSPRPSHPTPRLHFLPRDEENEVSLFQSCRYKDILLLELKEKDMRSDLQARARFTNVPLPTMCIILAFDYKTNELRFLIFQRDGLSTTHALDITQSDDRRSVRTLLCSALSRMSPHDVELRGLTNGEIFRLEVDENIYAHLDNGDVPRYLSGLSSSIHPLDGTRGSRNLSLPADSIVIGVGDHPREPSALESGCILTLTFCEVGKPLTACEDGKELSECILHAMLGWIHWFWAGFLHRDICIGTILRLDHPVECRPFVVPSLDELFKPFDGLASLADPASEGPPNLSGDSQADVFKLRDEVDGCRKTLERRVQELGLSQTCRAVLLDSDGAVDLRGSDYFKDKCPERIVGTPQFRSTQFSAAVADGRSYLQSPVDDLESFVWTALWALVYHAEQKDRVRWREVLYVGGDRTSVLDEVQTLTLLNEDSGPILCNVGPVLDRLFQSLKRIRNQWIIDNHAVDQSDIPHVKQAVRKQLLFHKYALRGLVGAIGALGLGSEGGRSIAASTSIPVQESVPRHTHLTARGPAREDRSRSLKRKEPSDGQPVPTPTPKKIKVGFPVADFTAHNLQSGGA
ncbi:hypothetical protein PENSPDRAFT_759329 [Peniophora sp. CONT]|nr:hypothetical protein PENSPDRAFT_759329 [Peniophora sp. CONT]